AAAGAAVAVVAPGVVHKFGDAFVRALHADPGWVVGGVGFELASFAGYIALFWYVANRATARIGLRASGEIALASTAATRLLPTVRHPDPRIAGAVAWWGFDMFVLWATFNAFGAPPAATVLVLGYFLGQVANTVPLPGAASGGMVGAFLALGMPAEVVLPAVL